MPLILDNSQIDIDIEIEPISYETVFLTVITRIQSSTTVESDSSKSDPILLMKNDDDEIVMLQGTSKLGFYKDDQLVFENKDSENTTQFLAKRK